MPGALRCRLRFGSDLTVGEHHDTMPVSPKPVIVDGEVIMAGLPSFGHQRIVGFLGGVLAQYVAFRGLGVVILPPFQMKMRQGREPDVLFLAKDHLDRLQATYLDGPADLVVEVTSLESAGRGGT